MEVAEPQETLEELSKKRIQALRSTRTTTRGCAQVLQQTEEIARSALIQLDSQGNQLGRIIETSDSTQDTLKASDKHIRSIQSIWGQLANKFSRKPKKTKSSFVAPGTEAPSTPSKDQTKASKKQDSKSKLIEDGRPRIISCEPVPSIILEDKEEKQLFEDTEYDLSCMAESVKNLKQMAISMGNELDNHSKNIDTVTTNVEATKAKVMLSSMKIRKL